MFLKAITLAAAMLCAATPALAFDKVSDNPPNGSTNNPRVREILLAHLPAPVNSAPCSDDFDCAMAEAVAMFHRPPPAIVDATPPGTPVSTDTGLTPAGVK